MPHRPLCPSSSERSDPPLACRSACRTQPSSACAPTSTSSGKNIKTSPATSVRRPLSPSRPPSWRFADSVFLERADFGQLASEPVVLYLLHKLPIRTFVAISIVAWSIVVAAQAAPHDYIGMLVVRIMVRPSRSSGSNESDSKHPAARLHRGCRRACLHRPEQRLVAQARAADPPRRLRLVQRARADRRRPPPVRLRLDRQHRAQGLAPLVHHLRHPHAPRRRLLLHLRPQVAVDRLVP